MADTTNISNLRINILTEEQLQEAIANELVSPDEFYFTPDDGDSKNETVTFTEAGTRTNITTGETHSVLFGKIKKWFADLKALAFKDKAATADIENSAVTNAKLANMAAKTI